MDGADDVTTDPLFVGLTRPATVWGIPYSAAAVEIMVTMVVFLAVGNPLYLLLAVPIHLVLYMMSANNPGRFNSLKVWIITVGRCMTRSHWKSTSFSPISKKRLSK